MGKRILDAGYTFHATPIANTWLNAKILPSYLISNYKLLSNNFVVFAKDPIPKISLYECPDVSFIIDNRGKGDPIAAAKYDLNTKHIKIIEPIHKSSSLMHELLNLRSKWKYLLFISLSQHFISIWVIYLSIKLWVYI